MKKQVNLLLALLLFSASGVLCQEKKNNEVTVEFVVLCGTNGELDAKEGTTVTMQVVNNSGQTTTLTYTFPQGTHARAITKYFTDALRSKGFEVEDPKHNDIERKSSMKIKNVKSVKVGTSLNGKLPVTITSSPPPRRPDTLPPPVITGKLPKLPKPTTPPKPSTPTPKKGSTTPPPHGPGSIQILVTQSNSSGGQGGTTTKKVTISISATQNSKDTVITRTFSADTSATQITKYFYDKLVKAGYKLKPYQPGDTQLFFNEVCKLDGSYSDKSARTTFGYGQQYIIIDDKGKIYNNKQFGAGAHYNMVLPALDELNDYLDWINATWSGNISNLNVLHGISISGIYKINPNFGFGAGYKMLHGSTSGRSIGGEFNLGITSHGGYILACGEWAPGLSKLNLGGQLNIGIHSARYTESEDQWEQTSNDVAMEYSLEARLGYQLADYLHVVASAGYQSLKFDDFGINWLSPNHPPVILDLSGFCFRLGLECKF